MRSTFTAASGLLLATLLAAAASAGAAQDATTDKPAGSSSAAAADAPAHRAGAHKAKGTEEGKAAEGAKGAAGAGDLRSKGSYSLGLSMGEQLHRAGITSETVSTQRLMQGFQDALSGKVKWSPTDQENVANLIRTARASAAETNHAAAKAFLAENGKKKDVVTTASGLEYKVIKAGSGDAPKSSDTVTVNYRGTLLDGTEFDSSYKRGQPASFPLSNVIPGWQEALSLMKPGAHYEIYIPPQLAYDVDSPPSIPPGSLLKFDVELLSVKPTPPPAAGGAGGPAGSGAAAPAQGSPEHK